MSTEIKPGQVWAWKPGSGIRDAGTEVLVTYAEAENRFVRYEYPDGSGVPQKRLRENFLDAMVLVSEPDDATPAPLDPSKVAITLKAGDYIEAESDGTKIGGPVSHVNENGFVSIQHLGSFAIEGITPQRTGYREFALTAHQPAPEPEPEWLFEFKGEEGPEGDERWVRRFPSRSDALRSMTESIGLPELDDFQGAVSFSIYGEATGPAESTPPTRDQVYDALLVAYRDELGPVGGTEQAFLIRATTDTLAILTGGAR